MGLRPSKEKIREILKNSMNRNSNEQNISKIECKYKKEENIPVIKDSAKNSKNIEGNATKTSPFQDVENIKKYPYIAIGTITVRFKNLEKDLEYTCFLIDTNVVVTLASNIEDKKTGERATKIKTTFTDEKVKSENVYIQGEDSKEDKKNAEKIEMMDKKSSKLAVIIYEKDIGSEWIGVERVEPKEFNEKEIYSVFTLGLMDNGTKKKEPGLREVNVYNNSNLFKNLNKEEKETAKKVPGSPIYYKDSNGGGYAVAIVNERYEFQYFDEYAMKFLADMVYLGKLFRKKDHKGIDEDSIVKLDLSNKGFEPLDIKYLTDYDLKNLRILDLRNNCIKPQGVSYLSQGKFSCLESLGLSNNEIGDDGLKNLVYGSFSELKELYLFHNNITFAGIKYLIEADFVGKLEILSLSENPKIGDLGILFMTENEEKKVWNNLNTLSLYDTGLHDIALKFLGPPSMPQLKHLNIKGNKFTESAKTTINELRMNHIHVVYRSQAERDKDNKRKEKEKEKEKENEKEKIKKEGKNK